MLSIIACGNPIRSDDGVGPYVLQALREDASVAEREDVQLFDAGTDGISVMYQARGSDALLLIDACQSGEPPGSVFEVPGAEFEDVPPEGQNLHAFRWDHALYAGRRIYADNFPDDVTVLLVEVESLAPGLALSETVARAAQQVIARVKQRVAKYSEQSHKPVSQSVQIKAASLYLSAELCAQYLPEIECIAPLLEERQLLLLPVQTDAGGCLLKIRNAAGDRVVQLQAFFRDQGWDETLSCESTVRWDPKRAALCMELPEMTDAAFAL